MAPRTVEPIGSVRSNLDQDRPVAALEAGLRKSRPNSQVLGTFRVMNKETRFVVISLATAPPFLAFAVRHVPKTVEHELHAETQRDFALERTANPTEVRSTDPLMRITLTLRTSF